MEKRQILILFLNLGIILFLLYLSIPFYQIFLLSVILAYFIFPVKKWLMKKVNNENLASLLSMLIGVFGLFLIIILVVSSLISGVKGIGSFANDAASLELINNTINLFESYNIQEPLTQAGVNQIVNFMQNLAFSTPQIIINLIVFIFLLFYFIKYGEEIINSIRKLIPTDEVKSFDRFTKRVNQMMRAIFYGQFITAFVQSIILFLFVWWLGLSYAFELSLFTFIMCFFNITVAVVPIGINIYYFFMGDYTLFVISVIFTLFITTIDNIIKPIIGEKTAHMNPVFFILGITTGALTLGFTGFIIGPLLFGMFQAGLEIVFEKKKIRFG